jgi:predicted dehydrogenase
MGLIDNCRFAGYGFECSAEIVGSDSTVRIGARGHSIDVDVLSSRGALRRIADDNIERHSAAYRDELRHFVGCLRDDAEPAVAGEDAIAALELALAAEASAA